MNNMEKLNQLGPITDEMLAGLQTDEAMRLRIVRAAREKARPAKKNTKRFAPVMALAAAALVCVGVASTRMEAITPGAVPMMIDEIAAGQPAAAGARVMADLGDGASVGAARSSGGSLFAKGSGEIPVVTVKGNVYRMLTTPQDIGSSLLAGEAGSVQVVTDQPSLASGADLKAGLSNVADPAATIYTVKGLKTTTAVAAKVDGKMRLFQRVSYAGQGPAGSRFEETFSIRGKVKSMTLDGVGTIEGGKANDVAAVLLDCASLKSAQAGSAKQYLTVTLDSGLKLQLGVSGDTLMGCGGWSCPEFFDAFENAVK